MITSVDLIRKKVRINTFILIGVLLSLLILVYSCKPDKAKEFTDNEKNEQLNSTPDSIFNELMYCYNECPDSVQIIADVLEAKLIKEENYLDLINLYSFMSMFYQQSRTNNPEISLEYLVRALEVSDENQNLNYDKTYLYINIGNIMNTYNLHDEAIFIYNQIPRIVDVSSRPSALYLINNNIALSYMRSERLDSARFYFDKTLAYIGKIDNREIVYKAQYYNYLSALAFESGDYKSLLIYCSKTKLLLSGIINNIQDYPEGYFEDIKVIYYRNQVANLDWTGQYYFENKNADSALYYWAEANKVLIELKDVSKMIEIYSSISNAYMLKEDYTTALEFLDTAISMVTALNVDYKLMENIYRDKIDIYKKLNRFSNIKVAEDSLKLYQDSVGISSKYDQISLMQVKLALRLVRLEIKEIEVSSKAKTQIIEKQEFLIKTLIGFLLFIAIALTIYYRLYINHKNTRLQLAQRTLEKISTQKAPTANSNQLKSSVEQELLDKIQKEIFENKAFLEPNITLVTIAERLNTNRSYISKIINTVYKMNFSDYINKLRIEESCEIICTNTDPNFTIDHLFSEVGFVGKSTFYNAFKKYTGVTPALFFNMKNMANSKDE
jgi:YesN/AraC family two-component response regulator